MEQWCSDWRGQKAEFNQSRPRISLTRSQATLKSRAGQRGSFSLPPSPPLFNAHPLLCIGYDVNVEEEAVEAISHLQRDTQQFGEFRRWDRWGKFHYVHSSGCVFLSDE